MVLSRNCFLGGGSRMFDAVQTLIGPVPAGYEPLVYVMCIPILLWLLSQFFGILWAIIGGMIHA